MLEAQACGCPVIASNIPAVREFAGDAAEYFNPFDTADIHRAMMAFMAEPSKRTHLERLGLARTQTVRAQPVVRHLLGAYERVVSNERTRARDARRARRV